MPTEIGALTKLPRKPVSALTVAPFTTGTLVVIAVHLSCLRPRAVRVAYVELMLTPPTCSAVALSMPNVAVAEKVLAPVMV